MVVFGTFGVFVEGGFVNTLLNLYQVLFGLLIVGLESQKPVLQSELKTFLFEYFRFLFTLFGRGCFYVLVGVVVMAANPWTNFFVGAFTTIVGFASLFFGFRSSQKLVALKAMLIDEVAVRMTFSKYDTDCDQKVTWSQFSDLLAELGVNLSHQELEAAVSLIGNDMERTVTADAFCAWYNEHLLGSKLQAA
jgi:hypothetical protein